MLSRPSGLAFVLVASLAASACGMTEQTVVYKFAHATSCRAEDVNVESQSGGTYIASGCGQARVYHCGEPAAGSEERTGPECNEVPARLVADH